MKTPAWSPKLESFADDYDLRCSGFIAPREEKPDYFITNQEEEAKSGLTEGDIVYLNRGRLNGRLRRRRPGPVDSRPLQTGS